MEETNSKEVNLLQLISLFFNWLKKLGKSIIDFIGSLGQLGYRHKIIVIITVLVCLMYGLYLSRPDARVYKAEAMAMLYGTESQTVKEVSKQLENSVSSNDLFSLATKLSLPDSVAENIVGIQSFYVIDYLKDGVADMIDFKNNHSLTDTLNIKMRDRIYLQIKTKNISQVPKVQAAILHYFNSNSDMKNQFEIKKSAIIEQIKICDNESKRIDSLAKVSYFKDADKQLQFDKNKLIVGEQRKQLFYDDLIRLHDIKSNSLNRLTDFVQPMDLPSGFVVYSAPENGFFKYGIMSILLGFLISLIISLFIENLSKVVSFLDKK
ncbi:MAG: hypothetical protein PHT07_18355 [Paludibacter sp.]|nr:hypothetical protein [Paludibacter sp.]